MGQLADTLGIGPIFTRNGQEYQVTPIKPYHRGMFEAKLEQWGRELIERTKSWVPESSWRTDISVFQQDVIAQRYSQSHQNYRDAMLSYNGIRYILAMLLRDQPKEKDKVWKERHAAIDEAWVESWVEEDRQGFPDKQAQNVMQIYFEAIGATIKQDEKKEDEQPAG